MSDLELAVYDEWFDPVVSFEPNLVPDGFIYLRADPDTCMSRMRVRDRKEEVGIPPAYMAGLHDKHERWFAAKSEKIMPFMASMGQRAMQGAPQEGHPGVCE